MKSIVVDGVKYVEESNSDNFNIVIVDRGFVYVGYTELKDNFLIIRKAKNIRIWGTGVKGLGYLSNGPTSDTVTDECGTCNIPLHAVINVIESDSSKWGM